MSRAPAKPEVPPPSKASASIDVLCTTLEVVGESWRKTNSKHCPVKLRTGDGVSVGACWHYLIGGVCPAHGRIYEHNKE